MKLLNVISLGAGVQSSALLIASDRGLRGIPRADMAIFADTQDEPAWVYENLERLEGSVSIPVERVTYGRLSTQNDGSDMGLLVPAFTRNPDGSRGMLRRQCTNDYKVRPIQRRLSELIGRGRGQRWSGPPAVALMLGISRDEAHRMKPSFVPYILNTFPLVDADLDRAGCVRLLKFEGVPVPKKSACVFCPFHDNRFWKDLKRDAPGDWAKAVAYDEAIRNSTKAGVRLPAYIHSSLRPLAEVDLNETQMEMFGNECEGLCGV